MRSVLFPKRGSLGDPLKRSFGCFEAPKEGEQEEEEEEER